MKSMIVRIQFSSSTRATLSSEPPISKCSPMIFSINLSFAFSVICFALQIHFAAAAGADRVNTFFVPLIFSVHRFSATLGTVAAITTVPPVWTNPPPMPHRIHRLRGCFQGLEKRLGLFLRGLHMLHRNRRTRFKNSFSSAIWAVTRMSCNVKATIAS